MVRGLRRHAWLNNRGAVIGVAVSAGGHLLLLALLAMHVARPLEAPSSADAPIFLDIEPRFVRPDEPVRKVTEAARQTQARQAAAQAAAEASPTVTSPLPSTPRPRLATPRPEAPQSPSTDAWQVRPEQMADAVARTLRAGIPGCRTPAILSAAERAACEQRFGDAAAEAAPIQGTGNARRDARFAREGARVMAQYEAQRRPLGSGVGVVGPADCVGSNFGTGCAGAHLDPAMRQGATTNIRQQSNDMDRMRAIPGNE